MFSKSERVETKSSTKENENQLIDNSKKLHTCVNKIKW